MALVSVLKAEKYDAGILHDAIARHFETLDLDQDIRPGMKVCIKPNLLAARHAEQAATTHPEVIRAVAAWLRERGIDDITIADSPGGAYRQGSLKAVYDACGYLPLQDVAKLNYDLGYTAVQSPEGFKNTSFNIIAPIVNADLVINIAKLKTHGLTTVTGGTKNLFGSIPGLQKPELHMKYPDVGDFCTMLVELAQVVKPHVTVIDAVDTMEGNGPLNGKIRHMGLLLASRDIFAQDFVAARLMGIAPEVTPIVHTVLRLGLVRPEDIKTVGDDAKPADPPYILPDTVNKGNNRGFIMRSFGGLIKSVDRPVPRVDEDKCRGCGKCAESCPMHLIRVENGKAGMSTKNCISCFCCQEMCPFDAVRVRHVFRLPRI